MQTLLPGLLSHGTVLSMHLKWDIEGRAKLNETRSYLSGKRVYQALDPIDVRSDRCKLFSLWPLGSWAFDTSVYSKLIITLGFVLVLHFIQ
jgi:hypothetical protein